MNSPDSRHRSDRPQRLGMILFFVYLALYGLFVYLNAFEHRTMAERHAFAGVNLAVIYGFGLIVLPIVLSLIYLRFARSASDECGAGGTREGRR